MTVLNKNGWLKIIAALAILATVLSIIAIIMALNVSNSQQQLTNSIATISETVQGLQSNNESMQQSRTQSSLDAFNANAAMALSMSNRSGENKMPAVFQRYIDQHIALCLKGASSDPSASGYAKYEACKLNFLVSYNKAMMQAVRRTNLYNNIQTQSNNSESFGAAVNQSQVNALAQVQRDASACHVGATSAATCSNISSAS